ncbi:MAG: hypothetical protein LM593_03825 [Candidatus Verstraetearchaeota archaeon]|nr:hypothetical protein [Candidatus Verstraetearchaeota archaeon]
MPDLVVHVYTGENFCNIPRNIYNEIINLKSIEYDISKIIINDHLIPEFLLYSLDSIYEKWGYNGIKALIHYNILDYVHVLSKSSNYGYLLKNYGSLYIFADIEKYINNILNNINDDFNKLIKLLESNMELNKIIEEIEKEWINGIKQLDNFKKIIMKNPIDFLKDIIKVNNEIKNCIKKCILEVLEIEFWNQDKFNNICPVCLNSIFQENYILIPEEYAKRNIAFKIHMRCFDDLVGKVKRMMIYGHTKEEIFWKGKFLKRLTEQFIAPSIIYEVLKVAMP